MSQISPPMRILLVGSVVFLAAWFAFLRPGGSTDTPAPPAAAPAAPAQSAPGQAVEAATSAAAAAEAADARSAGESSAAGTAAGATATTPASKAATAPAGKPEDAAALLGLPKPVARAFVSDKVLVLFFWNPRAADDELVRAEVRHADLHGKKVAVRMVNVRDIARYAPITRGMQVDQSPSIVVLDRKRQGTLLTGYVDSLTIQQAVSDALQVR